MEEQPKATNLTIKDVARALNVSTTTVSRAISGKGRIGEETARRVREYIQEHNYVPNAIAQGLADQRTYNLGFITPGAEAVTSQAFFQSCLSGICLELEDTPYDVVMVLEREDKSRSRLERALERGKLDGAIVSHARINGTIGKRLREAGVPYVVIGSSPNKSTRQVDHDHRVACAQLTSLLLKNKRELALLGGDRQLYVTQDRLQGFLAAHQEAGIAVRDNRLYFDLNSPERVETTLDAALSTGANCLVCMDDRICAMALSLLHHRGLRIPQDVQVASFYDSFILECYTPAITSLHFDAEKLGAAACRMLLAQLEGRQVPAKETVGYEIALRASTKQVE